MSKCDVLLGYWVGSRPVFMQMRTLVRARPVAFVTGMYSAHATVWQTWHAKPSQAPRRSHHINSVVSWTPR